MYEYKEPSVECPHTKRKIGNIVCETIPTNENCRIYHVRKPVYDAGRKELCIWERNAPDYKEGKETSSLFELLGEKCEGIESLFSPKPYQVWVTRGAAFEWDEVEPAVCEILIAYSGSMSV